MEAAASVVPRLEAANAALGEERGVLAHELQSANEELAAMHRAKQAALVDADALRRVRSAHARAYMDAATRECGCKV
jgi:hypothetical protein